MPKIYLNSKDVKGVDIVKHNGVCYTRTGVSTPASRVTLTDSADVKLFYTDCEGCLIGETAIPVGGTGTIASTASNLQIRFAGTTEGETGNLVFQDSTGGTCSVALSVNSNDQLVFDTAPTGNGPHTFSTIPMTIQYVACNTDKYDITLAGLGSYVLTVDHTGTGGALDPSGAEPNSLEFEQTIEGVQLDSLDSDAQAALIESTEAAITESTDSIASVEVTLESGSIIIKSIIKWIADQFEAKLAEFETLLQNTSTDGWTTKWQTKLTETFTSKGLDVAVANNLAIHTKNPNVTKKYTPGGDTGGGTTTTPTSGTHLTWNTFNYVLSAPEKANINKSTFSDTVPLSANMNKFIANDSKQCLELYTYGDFESSATAVTSTTLHNSIEECSASVSTDDDTGGGDTGGGTTTTPTSDTHVTWAMKNETSGDFIFINLPKSYLDDALLNKFINLNGAGLDGVSGCWKFSDVLTFESDPADGTVSSDFNASSHDTLSDCSNTI